MKINTSGICLYCQCKQRENEMTVHKNTIHYYAIICHAKDKHPDADCRVRKSVHTNSLT